MEHGIAVITQDTAVERYILRIVVVVAVPKQCCGGGHQPFVYRYTKLKLCTGTQNLSCVL